LLHQAAGILPFLCSGAGPSPAHEQRRWFSAASRSGSGWHVVGEKVKSRSRQLNKVKPPLNFFRFFRALRFFVAQLSCVCDKERVGKKIGQRQCY
jgi:hypothetical protein